MANWSFRSLFTKSGINLSKQGSMSAQLLVDKPAWLKLSNAADLREAVESNPVLYGTTMIISQSAANGKKYLVDNKGNEVSWDSNKAAVKAARQLFVDNPNPIQSQSEYTAERYYMLPTFGNNYVQMLNGSSFDTDILTTKTLMNLNSEFVEPKQTGKIFDQISLEGIVSEYALTNYNPVKIFETRNIIHFNELNVSGVGNSIMGTSRHTSLSLPIENVQKDFEAMNVILKSKGMQGIIKTSSKDGMGTQTPVKPAIKNEIDTKFANEYGLLSGQKQFLIVNADIEFIKTILNPEEMGIYKDMVANAMIICNVVGVPYDLFKLNAEGTTFENQIQAERRMYQSRIIPMVNNDDQIYTQRLKLRNYGLELRTSFDHIACLQENFKEEAMALNMNVRSAEASYNNNIITWNEYLGIMDKDPVSGGDIYKYERDKSINPKQDENTEEVN